MKRIVTALAAAAFSFALLFKCSEIIEPVKASAVTTTVTLTAGQTAALFGDELICNYRDSVGDLASGTFSFYGYSTYTINTTTKDCVVYKSNFTDLSTSSDSFTWLLDFIPTVSLSNISEFHMYTGYRCGASSYVIPNSWADANKFVLMSDVNDTDFNFLTFYMRQDAYNNSYKRIYTCDIPDIYINPNTGTEDTWYFTYYPITVTTLPQFDNCSIKFYDDTHELGMFTSGGPGAFDGGYYYIFIGTPSLSDTYVVDNNSSSGGSDNPDYSGDLQDILDKLDAIIANGYVVDGALDDIIDIGQGVHGDLQGVNSRLDNVNSNLNKIDSHIQALQIPDLVSQSPSDSFHIADNTSRMAAEISDAMQDHQYIDSIARSAEMSLPNLDNQHALDSSFNDVWYYTDEDGLKWSNPLLFAMPIVTLTIGVLSYIIFGKKG